MRFKLFLLFALLILSTQVFAQIELRTPIGTWKSYDSDVTGKPSDDLSFGMRQFYSFENRQANVDVIWQDQESQKIYLSYFNANFQQQKQVSLPMPGKVKLLAATHDEQDNYYYAVYQEIENTQDILYLYKVNRSGAQVAQKRHNSGKEHLNIWDFGNWPGALAYQDGKIALLIARRMNKSSDGLNHQSGWAIVFDAKTLAVTKSFGQTSGHSFDNFLSTNSAGEFLAMDLGDNYPRGIHVHKFDAANIKKKVVYTFKTYHGTKSTSPAGRSYPRYDEISSSQQTFYQWSNDNGVYTELGGIEETNDGYLVIFAGEPDPSGKSINNARATGEYFSDTRNLGFVKVRKDYENASNINEVILSKGISEKGKFYTFGGRLKEQENAGVVWLTRFKDAQSQNVMHIKTLTMPNGNILVLYATDEQRKYYSNPNKEKYQPYMLTLNAQGKVIVPPLKLPKDFPLNRRDEILLLGNKVVVAHGMENGKLRLCVLDLEGQKGRPQTNNDPKPDPGNNPSQPTTNPPTTSKSGLNFSRWRMNKGEGVIQLAGTGIDLKGKHGNPVAYQLAQIPSGKAPGWEVLDGEINMKLSSNPNLKECYQAVDFTYFYTLVDIPANTKISSLKVKIGFVDDGARMFIYNSKYPKGKFDPAMDGRYMGKDFTVDFAKDAVAGEVNAIVIIQMDDCPVRNQLKDGVVLEVNGEVVSPDPKWEQKHDDSATGYIGGNPEKKANTSSPDFDPNKFYRFTTAWQGDGKSLDVVNDGKNNRLQLTETGKYSGQYWKIENLNNGFYRLTTQWLGQDKSLDVVNDGTNNKIQMAKSGNYSGQYWKIEKLDNGFYRLTTQWLGEGKSLDVVNDGKNNRLQMADTGKYSGQYWKITELK